MEEKENDCPKCKLEVVTDAVHCGGLCNKKYHSKCIGFTPKVFSFYVSSYNLTFKCDECSDNPESVMAKTVKNIFSFLCIFEERLMRQEKSNEHMLKEFEIMNSALKQIAESKGNDENNITKNNDRKSYASVTKKSMPVGAVVIKPKKQQKSEETRADITKKADNPKPVNICGVKNISKGGVLISCKTENDTKNVQKEMSDKLGDEYIVVIPKKRKPKIKITSLCERMEKSEIIAN